ncbi:MAG: class I SAM-dependent methyltransferase [Anaerolineae bacterium]|nr:class I SAM-dependent methyltransferase [Anaerolineae bacterium]
MARGSRRPKKHTARTSWDPVAGWYDGWMGKGGSEYHRRLAIPVVLDLLDPQPGEEILDVGAGQGVLAAPIFEARARYTGVDLSDKLLRRARKVHGRRGRFIRGDARRLAQLPGLRAGGFDAVVFLLSIQNMDPLQSVLESAAWALKTRGRLVMLVTHPCFRVPRQSGWGWDEGRKLQYRRVDRYLTPLSVPKKPYPGQEKGVTLDFHRPLQDYVNGLADCGLVVDCIKEIPTHKVCASGPRAKARSAANREVPLFLGLRAIKMT